jgi:UDP-N-acetylmuramyl tripeptide synthase
VLNVDDELGRELAADVAERGGAVVRYGVSGDADLRLLGCDWTLTSGSLRIEARGSERVVSTRLPGHHNALNACAAIALAHGLGIDAATADAVVEASPPPPGRFELVSEDDSTGARPAEPGACPKAGPDVVVDYAHNPDGARAALDTARALVEPRGGRIVAVTSGLLLYPDRDLRELGRVLSAEADHLVLTTNRLSPDEPNEPAPGLVTGAAGGRAEVELEPDRRRAIELAVEAARPQDLVLILARGALTNSIYWPDDVARPFDDREEARAALARVLTRGC